MLRLRSLTALGIALISVSACDQAAPSADLASPPVPLALSTGDCEVKGPDEVSAGNTYEFWLKCAEEPSSVSWYPVGTTGNQVLVLDPNAITTDVLYRTFFNGQAHQICVDYAYDPWNLPDTVCKLVNAGS